VRAGGAGLDNCGAPYVRRMHSFRLVAICAIFPPDAGSRGIPTNRTGADLHSLYSDVIFESNEALRIARDDG
jgi:hypothetical protein